MADTKTTVELEAPPKWAIALSEKVEDVRGAIRGLETTVDTLVEDGKAANQRMTRIEIRMDGYESRADQNSQRVKGESEVNLQQDAAIATVLEKVDALDKKTDAQTKMLEKAGAVLKDPRVIGILVVLYTILKGWAEKKGYL